MREMRNEIKLSDYFDFEIEHNIDKINLCLQWDINSNYSIILISKFLTKMKHNID